MDVIDAIGMQEEKYYDNLKEAVVENDKMDDLIYRIENLAQVQVIEMVRTQTNNTCDQL